MSHWIYILGEKSGADVKIGRTDAQTVNERLKTVNDDMSAAGHSYLVLVAVAGEGGEESYLKKHFEHLRLSKGTRTEYFAPDPELVGYAAWLRAQYFAAPNGEEKIEDWTCIEPDVWYPDGPSRQIPRPESDEEKFVQDWEAVAAGELSGTPWAWFPNPKASIQDYFTPPEIVQAAAKGMGGIDLDAASHWLANRTHKIPHYFHRSYSAFEHDWFGRVWLNPPYPGKGGSSNAAWWNRITEECANGHIDQICILSPVWAFTTKVARPLMEWSSAMLLLSPTPKFWGNSEGKEGANHPHCIVYIDRRSRDLETEDRRSQVLEALRPFGIPCKLDDAE